MGIKNATCPPPGKWYVGYNQVYTADTYKDNNGNTSATNEMDITVFANINQFAWITEKKFLGANYGVDLFVPLVYTNLTVKAMGTTVIDDERFGLGDIFIDPLILCWYNKRWDAFFASGAYLPTGKDDMPASPGKGYWTFMHQAGATYYFDQERSWTISARGRFLHSTEDPDTQIRAGNEAIFEYGIGKDIPLKNGTIFTAGAIGYSYFQLTSDSGPAGTDASKTKGHAVGSEIQITTIKPFFMNLSLRYTHEFGVENNAQGDALCLTIATSF